MRSMKLSRDFICHVSGDDVVLVPVGGAAFSGVVRGNAAFGAVLTLLQTETTEQEIVAAMKARFDAPEDVLERDVAHILSELRKLGAIEEGSE